MSRSSVEFVPESIAITEEGHRVLLDQPTSLQLVIANEGNIEETEVLVLILVTDESGDTVYEKRTKLNTIGIENYKKDRAKRSQEINLETPKNNELSKPTLSGDLNSNILEN